MMPRFNRGRRTASLTGLIVACGLAIDAFPAPKESLRGSSPPFFAIAIVDAQTGRGVPLVELKSVNQIAYWSDSNGLIAFDEPGLFEQEVYFHVRSHGYELPADGFGHRGVKLRPKPGATATIKLQRTIIAERLYRITGQGIYRDSVLLGRPVPIQQPLLNGQVMGQDTVIATPYRDKIYWFWGDTERVSYPLGNFAVSGATSELSGQGGLDPSAGVDLTYFVDATGFSKRMCPDFGPGLHWIEGIMVVPDETGTQRLAARVSSQKGLSAAYAWHLAVFNDEKQIFESKVKWDIAGWHDSSHPFRTQVNGVDWLYLYPNWRVRPDLASLARLDQYEAFTCVAGDGKVRAAETLIDRDDSGRPRYSWKPGADRLHPAHVRQLVTAGRLQPGESWIDLHDLDTGARIEAGRGSVYWNDYRRRWVMLTSAKPGEVWFAEGDTPVGPWVYARRVLWHDNYNFYNPTQHPFFDQDHGRLIYFEGTYTASFSNAKEKTPRYDYNQIMYRLALDDARLRLPAPVYRVAGAPAGGAAQYLMRDRVAAQDAWTRIIDLPFFAMPPDRGDGGMIPIFAAIQDGEPVLQTNPGPGPDSDRAPLFFALPALNQATNATLGIVPLYEYKSREGKRIYATNPEARPEFTRAPEALCRVWRSKESRAEGRESTAR